MRASASNVAFSVLPPALPPEQFYRQPDVEVAQRAQGPDGGVSSPEQVTTPAFVPPDEVAFGPFRLLPSQFLLLEGDKPVRVGSRALEILIVLLERPGELITKQALMTRVWPNLFVEAGNLTVNISLLRRALRDGQDANRFIINVPGRGYSFVGRVTGAIGAKVDTAVTSSAHR